MRVSHDAQRKTVAIADPVHGLALRLNYAGRCVIDRLTLREHELLSKMGVATGIKVRGKWYTSRDGIPTPEVTVSGNQVTVSGIRISGDGIVVEETWIFSPQEKGLEWTVDRQYPAGVILDDTACPGWSFATMSTWTGALLSTGGVAWCKLFDAHNASYAMHSDSATFWNTDTNDCLDIRASGAIMAMRFTRERDDTFTLACEPTDRELAPKQGQYRFFRDRQDIWKPFEVPAGHMRVTYKLSGRDYADEFSRGDFKGIDGKAVREILNTIGRIGVIDDRIVGSNGWYSGYAVLHEPWFALMAATVDDPPYIVNLGRCLDYQRDYAIQPDGMVKSRWAYFTGDSQPGTYDRRGFYECQWGRLMDTQTSYAINVAEHFDLNGDLGWVRGQKRVCEKALDYLLSRDSNGNGLVEMAVDSRFALKSSDWLDVIWASFENGFVNAQLYRALTLWSRIERLLGDTDRSELFAKNAAHLRTTFNRSTDEGGFWDAKNKWYVYWRDKDGTVHGNNLTLPVNFMAIGYGICDEPSRRRAILDQVEEKMTEQKLFCWPVNIYPFERDETGNQPFPNYENGDIFLAWAEMGIRAYAGYRPEIAVKYLENILGRYNKDGLAFQRYLRSGQSGAGDDILANNCSAVIGLYRDIFGIQPRHNRLYLAPRMTKALEGSQIRYWLRGRSYSIRPGAAQSLVESGGWKLQAPGEFGLAILAGSIEYFDRDAEGPALTLTSASRCDLKVESWGSKKRWRVVGASAVKSQAVAGLVPRGKYRLTVNGRKTQVSATSEGRLTIPTSRISHQVVVLEPAT